MKKLNIEITKSYQYHTCPAVCIAYGSGSGSGSGSSSGGNPPYGGDINLSSGDKAPPSYPWRDKLKDADDFDLYLPHTLGMYKANSEGVPIRDQNGNLIPILDAYNCHYATYGANTDPTSFNVPFTKILAYPDLSNFRKLTGNEPVKVGDRVSYFIWQDPNQSWQSAISHSAIVTQVDADGYATQV